MLLMKFSSLGGFCLVFKKIVLQQVLAFYGIRCSSTVVGRMLDFYLYISAEKEYMFR